MGWVGQSLEREQNASQETVILGLAVIVCLHAPVKLSFCHDLLVTYPQQYP